jgi:hypothetical protein
MKTNEELALRVVKDMYWRWLPGMRSWALFPGMGSRRGARAVAGHCPQESIQPQANLRLPDLSDPATLGCLRYLVNRAWGDTVNVYREAGGHWRAAMADCRGIADGVLSFYAHTEAEALVLALEAAP